MAAEKRYGFGVEALAGLVAGASALAVLVVVMVLFLLVREHRRWTTSVATGVAARIASDLGAHPDQAGLEAACRGLVPTEGIGKAVFLDSTGAPVFAFPEFSQSGFVPEDWVFVSARGPGSIGVLPGRSEVAALAEPILASLGVICLALALTALLMPAYLRSRVIDPLRKLLLQADSYRSGGGTNPGAASVSFHTLVELLSEKERELETLRELAVARADLAESRAGAVLEMLDSAVAAIDPSGALILWNARAQDLYELSEEDRGNPFPFSRTALGAGTGNPGGEVELGGRTFRVKTLSHAGGETILTATDISDILQLERRLADERSLADLGAFSGGVVHEIGNTLCAVRGFLDLLARGERDARSRQMISEARLELDSASRVVDAFRTLAGSGNPDFSRVSGEEVLGCVERECRALKVPFFLKATGDRFYRTDAVLLARCVRNLLENALEHCPAEDVAVTVEGSDPMTILVTDRGPGLPDPPETVFQPLYSTGRDRGHMGIGLTVTRRIIHAMGGRIVPANTGSGASFLIWLPGEEHQ